MKRTVLNFSVVIALIAASGYSSSGQTIILEYDVNEDTLIDDFGMNSLHYAGYYFGYGMVVGDKEGNGGLSLRKNESRYLEMGLYYKGKVSELYSLTGEIGYRSNVFVMKPNEVNLPNIDPSSKSIYSKLVVNNVHAGLYNRFNYGRRGDIIGRYLALGISFDYGYLNKTKEKKELLYNTYYKYHKEVRSQLDYINRVAYHAEIHLGFNAFVLTGAYRLNELIKKKEEYQMPGIVIGLRIDTGAF